MKKEWTKKRKHTQQMVLCVRIWQISEKKSEFLFPHLPSRDLNDWQKGVCYHIRSLYTIKRRQ